MKYVCEDVYKRQIMESQILSAFILPPSFQSINVVIEYVDKILLKHKTAYRPHNQT